MIKEIQYKKNHIAALEAEKQNLYDKSISSADAAFKTQNWKLSKQFYNDALSVFPDEKYPKDQLVIIEENILKEEQEKKDQYEKNQQFEDLLMEGDEMLISNNYSEAKNKYLAAKNPPGI